MFGAEGGIDACKVALGSGSDGPDTISNGSKTEHDSSISSTYADACNRYEKQGGQSEMIMGDGGRGANVFGGGCSLSAPTGAKGTTATTFSQAKCLQLRVYIPYKMHRPARQLKV